MLRFLLCFGVILFLPLHQKAEGQVPSNFKRDSAALLLKAPPNGTFRPSNAIIHHDTVLFQNIWTDPEGFTSFVSPVAPYLFNIVPPFKINGKSYYHKLESMVFAYQQDHLLPNFIIPDSTLILLTWWCDYPAPDTMFCVPETDEIETINGDPNHWHERFHRPYDSKIEYDTGIFNGFGPVPAAGKAGVPIFVKGNSNSKLAIQLANGFISIAPPLFIDGKPFYRQVTNPPKSTTVGISNAAKEQPAPCPGCPHNLIPGHTRIAISVSEVGCDEIYILGQE